MEPPVPIPNTEVKLRSADDTASARVWENRSLPGDYFSESPRYAWAFFVVKITLDAIWHYFNVGVIGREATFYV